MRAQPLIAIVLTGVMTGCSVIGIRSGYEQPEYEAVQVLEDNIEVRRYEPRLAAQTVATGSDLDEARSTAFRRLFDYISGENAGQTDISMTAPVESAAPPESIDMTTPVESRVAGDRVQMRFFLPSEWRMSTAPRPTNPEVELVELPGETLAVFRFSGRWSPDLLMERTEDLLEAVERSEWRVAGDPLRMFYDPPFTLPWLRRNEVAVPVTRAKS